MAGPVDPRPPGHDAPPPAMDDVLVDLQSRHPELVDGRWFSPESPGCPDLVVALVTRGLASAPILREELLASTGNPATDLEVIVVNQLPAAFDDQAADKAIHEALLAGLRETGQSSRYVAPATDTERFIARTWETTLEVDRVGRFDNYLELGGDSVRALEIVAVLSEEHGIEITLGDLFDHLTVSTLARMIAPGDYS